MNCHSIITLNEEQLEALLALPGGAPLEDHADEDSCCSLRCDLAPGHLGSHLASTDYCALDEPLPVTTSWLHWDELGHRLSMEKSCADCLLPAGHPQGSGCTDPLNSQCEQRVSITEQELAHLNGLPDAAHCVDPAELVCPLEPGHPGQHSTLGQSQDRGNEDCTDWWIVWQHPQAHDYQIITAPACPATHDDPDTESLCLHIQGHGGRHSS